MNISETIFLDLCHSLGALLYGTFILKKRKFQELENVKSYNMNTKFYSLYQSNKEILTKQGENLPFKGNFILNKFFNQFNFFKDNKETEQEENVFIVNLKKKKK
jgi:hypothetical protein